MTAEITDQLDSQDATFSEPEELEDLEAYARILSETISGFSLGFSKMCDVISSLQEPGSDNERRLKVFSETAQNIGRWREKMEQAFIFLAKNKNKFMAAHNLIQTIIDQVRGIVDEFIKNVLEKIKYFAKKHQDLFWTPIRKIRDAFLTMISYICSICSYIPALSIRI
jgi:hypothetical protein